MPLTLDKDVLLFFEDRDRDTFVRGDRKLRRMLRKAVYAGLRPGRQKISGFELSFVLLKRALEQSGKTVHVNDFALAKKNPTFPVGLCGYAHILNGWTLPNPAVLGPGIYDHPKQAPALMKDARFRSYIAFCSWMKDLFATIYPRDQIYLWFGGMDLAQWPDHSLQEKDIDFLVYDKIRWERDDLIPSLRQPIIDELTRRGLRSEIVQYGFYTHESYRDLLRRSKAMIFLCEHETQGMAYQEAMATNVPILAWDQGFWLDPNRPKWEEMPVPASSVPYFSSECGETFTGATDFAAQLDTFLERRSTYTPRAWVAKNLSFQTSAELYMRAYANAAASRTNYDVA